MKSLGVATEEACIASEALDKYAAVFHNPLSASQIKVLVALFRWSLSMEQTEVGTVLAVQGS
jgi:hypothetical protein